MKVRINLENRVQKVLYSVFNFGPKTKPTVKPDVTYIACPYCGDSKKDLNKKRFTIYWEKGTCYCYNCQKFKRINNFLHDFKEELSYEETHWIQANAYKKIFSDVKSDTIFDDQEDFKHLLKYSIKISDLNRVMGCQTTPEDHEYLNSRHLGRFHEEFSEYYPKFGPFKDNLIIMNKIDPNRVIGITIRDNRPNTKNKYFIYTLEKIYEKFFPERYRLFKNEGIDLSKYNKISYYYGFFDLDFNKPITVFEGPIDRLFHSNSVAISSLWRDYSFFKQLDNVRFFFDDDKVAKSHTIKLLKDKKEVFLWSKFKAENKLKNKKIKDMNDLIITSFNDKKPYFKNTADYFSNDILDIMKI